MTLESKHGRPDPYVIAGVEMVFQRIIVIDDPRREHAAIHLVIWQHLLISHLLVQFCQFFVCPVVVTCS